MILPKAGNSGSQSQIYLVNRMFCQTAHKPFKIQLENPEEALSKRFQLTPKVYFEPRILQQLYCDLVEVENYFNFLKSIKQNGSAIELKETWYSEWNCGKEEGENQFQLGIPERFYKLEDAQRRLSLGHELGHLETRLTTDAENLGEAQKRFYRPADFEDGPLDYLKKTLCYAWFINGKWETNPELLSKKYEEFKRSVHFRGSEELLTFADLIFVKWAVSETIGEDLWQSPVKTYPFSYSPDEDFAAAIDYYIHFGEYFRQKALEIYRQGYEEGMKMYAFLRMSKRLGLDRRDFGLVEGGIEVKVTDNQLILKDNQGEASVILSDEVFSII